jgi:hypothetical protein
MLAAGYVLGAESLHKAKSYDEEHMFLAQKAKVAVEKAREKIVEVDQKLHISENVVFAAHTVAEKAKEVDQTLGVSQKASAAAGAVKDAASTVTRQPLIAGFKSTVQGAMQGAAQGINTAVSNVREDTKRAIREKQGPEAADPNAPLEVAPEAAPAPSAPPAEQ